MLVQWVSFIYNIRFYGPGQEAQDCAVELEPCVCDPVRSRNHAVRCFEIFTVSALYLLVHTNIVLLQPDSHPCFWSNCAACFFLYPSFFLWASLASFSSFDCFFRVRFAFCGESFLFSGFTGAMISSFSLRRDQHHGKAIGDFIHTMTGLISYACEYRMQISLS